LLRGGNPIKEMRYGLQTKNEVKGNLIWSPRGRAEFSQGSRDQNNACPWKLLMQLIWTENTESRSLKSKNIENRSCLSEICATCLFKSSVVGPQERKKLNVCQMRDGLVLKDSLRTDKKDKTDMEGIIHCMSSSVVHCDRIADLPNRIWTSTNGINPVTPFATSKHSTHYHRSDNLAGMINNNLIWSNSGSRTCHWQRVCSLISVM
jgi:hypothetical protein